MKRIHGTTIVAWWLIGSSALALTRLLARGDDILAHGAAWPAAVGPFLVAVGGLAAARRLLRQRRATLAATLLAVQLLAISAGPLAYRLDAGPFARVVVSDSGVHADIGNDARLLLILGDDNRLAPGLAVNVFALAALAILLSVHRATLSPGPGASTISLKNDR